MRYHDTTWYHLDLTWLCILVQGGKKLNMNEHEHTHTEVGGLFSNVLLWLVINICSKAEQVTSISSYTQQTACRHTHTHKKHTYACKSLDDNKHTQSSQSHTIWEIQKTQTHTQSWLHTHSCPQKQIITNLFASWVQDSPNVSSWSSLLCSRAHAAYCTLLLGVKMSS